MDQALRAHQSYQRAAIETASREKLVLMLYDGALRFMNQAKVMLKENRIEEAGASLVRTENILSELMSSLRLDTGAIAKNLYSLYVFMYGRLVDANLTKDEKSIQDVIDLMTPLRETWAGAMAQMSQANSQNVIQ